MPKKQTQALLNWQTLTMFGLGLAVVFIAAAEIFSLGWGSGSFIGKLSVKWALTLATLYLTGGLILATLFVALYQPKRWTSINKQLIVLRNRMSEWRWIPFALSMLALPWFVFYSPWGGLFTGLFFRLVLFAIFVLSGSFFLGKKSELASWKTLLTSGLVAGVLLVLAESFVMVTDYPFALHWSEGNRIWDYSVMFGGSRYNYGGAEPLFAWIDSGRQALWGLPFLIPDIPIWAVRLWSAILVTLPYALLGWVAFIPTKGKKAEWLFAGLWVMIFLNQGPIYTPLVLAAILVAVVRRKPIWLAIPLLYLAGDYAGSSRFSWRFAPAIWAVILTFGDAVLLFRSTRAQDWLRAFALGLAGIWTKGLPLLIGIAVGLLPVVAAAVPEAATNGSLQSVENLQGLQAVSTQHPFLWERLVPNPIYPPGILIGLGLAVLPLIGLLMWLAKENHWKTDFWQWLATVLGLGAMLVVGVIASAKVGGGTDLHNMDMFLIGLVFVAALAWEGFSKNLNRVFAAGVARAVLAGLILIPAFMPMVKGKPLDLPGPERATFVMSRIQAFVECAREYGEVLFMDQRQLITFGHVGDLPLVDEYEKKYVMDKALAGDEQYFSQFYEDLSAGRFSLIVSEREAVLYKENDVDSIGDSLIEENNAWVNWVSIPLLGNYESVADYKDAAIELFMPIERSFDCP